MELDPTHLAALAGWIYLIVFAASALDAVVPIVPSESVIVTGAVLAAHGDVSLAGVLLAAAAGAIAGDAFSYGLGARVRHRRLRTGSTVDLGGRTGKAVAWAERMLRDHGPGTLITSRFIPGGRTATTFTAGYTAMPGRTFGSSITAGGLIWATQATLIGFAGGHVFGDNVLLGAGIGIALGAAAGIAIEWARTRRHATRTVATASTVADVGSVAAPASVAAEAGVVRLPVRPAPEPIAA